MLDLHHHDDVTSLFHSYANWVMADMTLTYFWEDTWINEACVDITPTIYAIVPPKS